MKKKLTNLIRTIKSNTELVIALFSMALSILTAWQTSSFNRASLKIAEGMNQETAVNYRLSVLPSIIFSTNAISSDPDFDFLGVEIENRGIGPAIIFPPVVLLNGSPIGLLTQDSKAVIQKLAFPDGVYTWNVHNAMTLMPGQKKKVFWSDKKDSVKIQKYFAKTLPNINIVVGYTSIYHEALIFNCQNVNRINDVYLVADQIEPQFKESRSQIEPMLKVRYNNSK